MKVAIQGIAGSFHHQAAEQLFGDELALVERKTFRDVFEAVQNGQAERGVVAIENSLHGSINPVYRLLAEQKLWVCGEIRLKIELFLIGGQYASLTDEPHEYYPIDTVFSQAEALSQCENWLDTHLPAARRQELSDTAESVRYVTHQQASDHFSAIASKAAAERYSGSILAGPINDDPDNYTRFFILAKEKQPTSDANRTSIILTEKTDQPGSLYEALGHFKTISANLSKLDSHPLPGKQRRYAFYVDIDAGLQQLQPALDKIKTQGWTVQILGSWQL